jgi:hypothetical protein
MAELEDIAAVAAKLFAMRDGAQADLKALHEYLNGEPANTPWFFNSITALLRAAGREYHYLNIGYQKTGRVLSWAARNLLEIDIFTEYTLKSEENAKRFSEDQIIDALDIFNSFKAWIASGEPNVATPLLDLTIADIEHTKAQQGITRTKYLRTEDIADSLNRLHEYKHFSKVASKLIHPTAWSLFAVQEESELLMLKPYLYRAGTFHFMATYKAIRNHVQALGTEPPP